MTKLSLLWPYSHEDKTTWKYSGFIIERLGDGKLGFKRWVLNPNFKYGYLEKRRCKCGRTIKT